MSSSYREVLRKNALETFRFDESHDGDDWIITICHDIMCNECRCTVKEIVRNQVVNEHDTTFVRSHSAITVAADVNILDQALNIDSRDKLFEPGRWIRWRPSKIDRKRRSRSPSSAASKTSSKIPRRDKRKYETTEYYIASTAKTFFTGLNTILDQQAEQLIEDVKALLVDGTTKSFIAHWKKFTTTCAKDALRKLANNEPEDFFLSAETAIIDIGLRRSLEKFRSIGAYELLGFNPIAFYDWYCDADGTQYDSICKEPQYGGLATVSRKLFTEFSYADIATSIEARVNKLAEGLLPDESKKFIVDHAPGLAGFTRRSANIDASAFRGLSEKDKVSSILIGTFDPTASDVVDIDVLYLVVDAILNKKAMRLYTNDISNAEEESTTVQNDASSAGTKAAHPTETCDEMTMMQPDDSDIEDASSDEDEVSIGDNQSIQSPQASAEDISAFTDSRRGSQDFTSQLEGCGLNFPASPNPMCDHDNDEPAGQTLSFMSDEEFANIMENALGKSNTRQNDLNPMNGHENDDPAGNNLSLFDDAEFMKFIESLHIPEASSSHMGNT
ncbi:hypothetical protein MAJ_07969, partial [Metarhizium majus ARSEF 297]